MAIVNAVASGNWSNPAIWSGGSVPVDGDTVSAVTFTIDFDVDIVQPLTTLTATSGFFRYAGAAVRSVTAIANLGTHTNTNGLIQNTSTGTLVFNGPVAGGSSGGIIGARNVSTGTLTIQTATGSSFVFGSGGYGASNVSTGTLNCTNAIGGANHDGVANLSTGTVNVANAVGGTSLGVGVLNIGNGTANVGTSTGSAMTAGSVNQAAGTLNVDLAIGNNFGPGSVVSASRPGVTGSSVLGQVTRVKRIQFGPYGAVPVSGAVLLSPDPTNTAQFRTVLNGAVKTLADPGTFADSPVPSDVRAGTEYNNGNNVGTCAVPLPSQVSAGTAVDATVGTAVITADQLYAVLQRNPAFTAERTLGDDKPLTFSWPNSTDIVQGDVSINNGNYVPVSGVIAYLRSESGKYYYTLAYSAADRPTEEGTARYRFYGGSHSIYATLRTIPDVPQVDAIAEGVTDSIERQDGMSSEILEVVSRLGYTAASNVSRPLDDTNPIRFVFVEPGQTLTGTKAINGGTPTPVSGSVTEVDLGLQGNWYQLAYHAADRPGVGEFVVYTFTDGVSDQSVLLTVTAPLETALENMPAEVWSNPDRELTAIDLDPVLERLPDTLVDGRMDSFVDPDQLAEVVSDVLEPILERLPAELVDGRMDSTLDPDQFDEIISTIIGAAPGMGGTVKPITITVAGQPAADAAVWVTTDQSGQVLVAGALSTDAFGVVNFMLDTGTYYAWVQKTGYNFTNPTEFAVADVDTTIDGVSIVPGSNLDDTDLITAVLRVRDQVGQPCVGVKVEVEVIGDPAVMDDKVLINTPNPVFTLSNGQAVIRVYRGQSYLYRVTYRRFPPVELTRVSPTTGDDFIVTVAVAVG